jgi:hypothetical protein
MAAMRSDFAGTFVTLCRYPVNRSEEELKPADRSTIS